MVYFVIESSISSRLFHQFEFEHIDVDQFLLILVEHQLGSLGPCAARQRWKKGRDFSESWTWKQLARSQTSVLFRLGAFSMGS